MFDLSVNKYEPLAVQSGKYICNWQGDLYFKFNAVNKSIRKSLCNPGIAKPPLCNYPCTVFPLSNVN